MPRARTKEVGQFVKLDWHGEKVLGQLRRVNRDGLTRVAEVVAVRAKQNVAVDTGALQASIKATTRKMRSEDQYMAKVKTGAGAKGSHYGLAQEVGLPHRKKYTFKPFLRPALAQSTPEIEHILKQEAQKKVRQ